MSDPSAVLPTRPSLEQLRKQAKERLDQMPGAKLADAQFALARDYGFESWPKLVHHVEALASPEVEQQERIARDMVAAFRHRDEAAAARLNDLFHSSLTLEQIHDFIRNRLFPLPGSAERIADFGLADARLLVAGMYGFADWDAFIASTGQAAVTDPITGRSLAPPFYRIDAARGTISPAQPMSPRDWDTLIGIIKERGLTGVEASNLMDDVALAKLADIDHVRILKLHGSDRVTDDGMRHIGRMSSLEELEVGGWKSPITDAGFAAVGELPHLRVLRSHWTRRITDAGVHRALLPGGRLEDVNLMGTPTGDRTIEALAGKANVDRVFIGTTATDAGLARLREFPKFASWHAGAIRYGLMEFDAGPTYFAVEGRFSPAGLKTLQSLHGLFALKLQWQPGTLDSAALGQLAPMENLGFLGIEGDTCDDEAMRQIGRLPKLRMLLAQTPVAGDAGFEGLSRSRTLEYYWGRECANLTGRGFRALSTMPSLRGLAVSCKGVDDASLACLPRFPALTALMPMDVPDAGFRHIGKCERLQDLWCMYCRDTGDAATKEITGLQLRTYYAGSTRITDRSLEMLGRMPTLEAVLLHYCQHVTTDGVRGLAALPALREIAVEGCRNVAREAMAAFRLDVRATYSTV